MLNLPLSVADTAGPQGMVATTKRLVADLNSARRRGTPALHFHQACQLLSHPDLTQWLRATTPQCCILQSDRRHMTLHSSAPRYVCPFEAFRARISSKIHT